MKYFIVEITYRVPAEQLGETVQEHRSYLQNGYDQGWLLCSGPQSPKTGGIVVMKAPSLKDVQLFFEKDPYNLKGLTTYRFIEFNPVKFQPFLQPWIG